MNHVSFFALLLFHIFTFAETYHIGPGKKYQNIGDTPLASLSEGDSVIIYYRDEPYREKWVITAQGSETRPVVFHGVPVSGKLPVIDGQNAVTPSGMNFWSEGRGVIKVGGSNNPPDNMPSHIIIENLEIRNGSSPLSFTGRNGMSAWNDNAAAIFLEKGEHITIRNCILHHCGNGFFSSHQSRAITVEYCYIYGNGHSGSIYEHNNYTESFGIIFQFNHFGPLRDGADGNNLKDRSTGCVIRYNWIESGNRQLDLVDSDYEEFTSSSGYKTTFVYGNILIEPDEAGNSQIIHYGGDSGEKSRYRKGMLYLYNNTIVSMRSGNTTLLRLSSPDETADVRNNVIFVSANGSRLGIVDNDGTAHLRTNWLKKGWVKSHSNASASVTIYGTAIEGSDPGFTDLAMQNFHPVSGSACIDGSILLADACLQEHKIDFQYMQHQNKELRIVSDHPMDIGAFDNESLSAIDWNITTPAAAQSIRRTRITLRLCDLPYTQGLRSEILLNGRSLPNQSERTRAVNIIVNR
jgi:hypothetical protein